jgi:glucosylglycerate synthase
VDEATSRRAEQQLEEIGRADLLVGILETGQHNREQPPSSSKGVELLRQALGKLSEPARTIVVDASLHEGPSQTGEESGGSAVTEKSFTVLPSAVLGSDSASLAQGIAGTYRRIFALAQQLDVKACCVVASSLDTVTSRWFYWLAQPVLELGYDLVTPCYLHAPFEGLLNASIISPLYCALYGHNIQNPIGPDIGLSKQAVQRMLGALNPKGAELPLVSLLPSATGAGLKLCQAYLGRRVYPPTDWSALSSLLPPILGPIFAEIEREVAVWQRIRGLRTVTTFRDVEDLEIQAEPVDSSRMIESFQLGIRDLREIYSLVLPPSTLLELTKLSRLGQDKFRMPDLVWARIIYDFAASFRLRTLNRDHLLRALTPLYLGWAASYALEVQAGAVDLQSGGNSQPSPLARLVPAFESVKPYFVSRWRWPDRFNP